VLIVGDIHGKYASYLKLLRRYKAQPSVQIGDFGIGFPGDGPLPEFPANARFFRGNHDNPAAAWQSEHYLGDFGMTMIDGYSVFYLSGARSSDRDLRVEGKDWWPGEELPLEDLEEAVKLYAASKPEIVLTHDGPDVATREIVRTRLVHKGILPSRTAQTLNAMYDAHQPERWIFGHWHTRWRLKIGQTDFRCLPELGWCEVRRKGVRDS
jgi:hypothetical protein